MKRFSVCLVSITLLVVATTSSAHTIVKKPFQKRYKFKSVTCYACHANGKDEKGKRLGKEVLNDFGKAMHKITGEKKFKDRIAAAKKADRTTRKKEEEEIIKEFLETLKQLEKVESTEGTPWGALIKEGKIDGVKMATPPAD